MIKIPFIETTIFLTALWVLVRLIIYLKTGKADLKRELLLLLVYVCIMVAARVTFFPFGKIEGKVQPLLFDINQIFPPKINLIPFVYLFDYPELKSALLNLIGNYALFIPMGIVWPSVFKELNSHLKVLLAGFGFSMIIEILQLPFFERTSDIDDLILNFSGYLTGYLIYLLFIKIKKHFN
ncbi:MAG: VanZ family protein [Oscillospiraceae bacterium]|nr:VanZ family protein [Oscillospiraceae bacterium]